MSGVNEAGDHSVLYSNEFPLVKLHYVAEIVGGGTPTSSRTNWDGEVPFATPVDLRGLNGNLLESTERTLTEEGAVKGSKVVDSGLLMSCRAPIGYVGTVGSTTAFNQGCKSLAGDFNERYMAFVLLASRSRLEACGDGTTFKEISAASLGNFRIPLPSLPNQRAIADYLDRETAEIDAMAAELEELITKLEERKIVTISRDVLGGSELADANIDLNDNYSREIFAPHWETSRFALEFQEQNIRHGDNPVGVALSISEFRGVEVRARTDGQQASLDVSNYKVVRPGQLAVNSMWLDHGGLGVSEIEGYVSPAYAVYKVSDRLEPHYAHHLLRSVTYVNAFKGLGQGVRPNSQLVGKTELGMLPIPLPSLDEQLRIVEHLDEVTAEIDSMIADAQELKALLAERRSALITEVVTGRKEVPVS